MGQGSLLVQKRYIPNEERERRCRDILFSYLALICLKKLGLGDIYPLVAESGSGVCRRLSDVTLRGKQFIGV